VKFKTSIGLVDSADGWIKAELTMTTSAPLSEEQIKRKVSFGKPEDHDFAKVEQYDKRIVVVYRRKPEAPAP
jgi:hypothetical protein